METLWISDFRLRIADCGLKFIVIRHDRITDREIEAFRQIAPGHVDVRGRMPARIVFTGKQGETMV